MNSRIASRYLRIVVPVKPLVPRFGVMPSRREEPKKGTFVRHCKHRGRAPEREL